jgi:hypothetical protein
MPYAKPFSPRLNASCSRSRPRRRAVFQFIEGWYNPHRRYFALDYLSPMDYERDHAAAPGSDRQQVSAPPPLAAGKIADHVIETNCIGEASNQLASPTPSTETG